MSGGLLEVQPHIVTIMADTAIRTEDLDEQRALEARDAAKQIVQNTGQGNEFMQAAAELARAAAQLRAIEPREIPALMWHFPCVYTGKLLSASIKSFNKY